MLDAAVFLQCLEPRTRHRGVPWSIATRCFWQYPGRLYLMSKSRNPLGRKQSSGIWQIRVKVIPKVPFPDERPIDLRVWYLRGALARDTGMLREMMAARQQDVLRTRFAAALIKYKWSTFALQHFWVGFISYLIYLFVFITWTVDLNSRGWPYMFSLFFLSCQSLHFFWEELQEYIHSGGVKYYFSNIWNILDLLRICLTLSVVIWSIVLEDWESLTDVNSYGPTLVAYTAFFSWLKLLSFGRGLWTFGHLIQTITQIIISSWMFLVLIFVLLLGFSHSFLIICCSLDFATGSLHADIILFFRVLFKAWMFVYYRGIIGELEDLDGCDLDQVGIPAKILYVVLTLFLMVVMLNLLIAIMTDAYTRVQENSEVAGNKMRAELISEKEAKIKTEDMSHLYLFVCRELEGHGQDIDEVDEIGWEGSVHEMKKEVKPSAEEYRMMLHQITAQRDRLKSLDSTVKKLSGRVNQVETNLFQGQARIERTLHIIMNSVCRDTSLREQPPPQAARTASQMPNEQLLPVPERSS